MYCHSFLVLNDPEQIIIADSRYIDERNHLVSFITFSFMSKEVEIVKTQYIRLYGQWTSLYTLCLISSIFKLRHSYITLEIFTWLRILFLIFCNC